MLGEDELIAHLIQDQPTNDLVILGSGDDCAVLAHPDGRCVISTDLLVEGVHFRRDWSTLAQIGARAAQQNMADIAAMGAAQHSAVVGLTLPPDLGEADIAQLNRGFATAYGRGGGAVVGGDLSRGPCLMIAVTVVGNLAGRAPLTRSGARPGDAVIFAGKQGYSAAGLELLQAGIDTGVGIAALTQPGATTCQRAYFEAALAAIHHFQVPNPPLQAGVQAALSQAHALMDVSDGLSRDLGKIATASQCHIDLSEAAVAQLAAPLQPLTQPVSYRVAGVEKTAPAIAIRRAVLAGGEDHGLVGTCSPHHIPPGFTVIGSVLGACEGGRLTLDGRDLAAQGHDHFASARQ